MENIQNLTKFSFNIKGLYPSLWIGVNLADIVTTSYSVYFMGMSELNPIMSFFLTYGLIPFIFAKIAITGGVLFLLRTETEKEVKKNLRMIIFIYSLILINNVWWLVK